MMKYIDADKLKAEIERRKKMHKELSASGYIIDPNRLDEDEDILSFIDTLQHEQPNGKQVIIITETDGDANIHWDCRSLEDVRALLASAESYISNKQNEELRGCGSGPDYNTEEGRYSSLFKHRQKQPEDTENKQKPVVQWPNLSNCKHDCKTCFAKCFYSKEQNEEQQPKVDLEKEIDAFFDKWDKNSYGCIFDENGALVTIKTIKGVVKHFLNARKEK